MAETMQIGDKVRFLDDVGGGRVAGFQGRDIVLVEDKDGFQIPAPRNKVVVVEPALTVNPVPEPSPVEKEKVNMVTVPQPDVKRVDLPKAVVYRSSMKQTRRNEPMVVDLHVHELLETTAGMSYGDILRYQLRAMREVLDEQKNNKGQKIVFIHGKGQGVLRNAVVNELKHYYPHLPYQDASFSEYGYGATQVTIK